MSFRSTIVAAAALFATANAHVKIVSPVPFSVDTLDTAPITKAQFPCKSNLGFKISTMNTMAVGKTQTLKLSGTAVHGGGSCQLSVTTDTEPTENSVFKVIKSMEGGCPGVDGATKDYSFELPDSIPNGNATFAWTWFSKLSGAPELYMNCAPIEVTGGASDQSAFKQLPDMFVANIGEGCTSPQNFATKFPNPGQVVEMGTTNDQKDPTGSCGATGSAPADPSSPAGGSPSPAPSSAAAGQPSPVPSYPGGVFAPGASSAAPVASGAAPSPSAAPVAPSAAPIQSTSTTLVTVTGAPTAPLPAAPTVPAGTGAPAAPTAPSTPSAGSSGTCTDNGAVVCNGPTQFGLCNNGQIVWQAVAAGTTCVNGSVTKRSYNGRIARPRYNARRVVPGRD
ncbi:hypothetical protein EJ02DRAFT_455082 [Clathrospora elynae]|uniref:Lytic polysaccharide monooxygenase n=1 Tax=Clathrospora elynae TaxID=706981 RepID=A0A6A5SPI3_9PLEO|nr:hypothetical protein EJ02DRAFT_455082 [Clathrospora elynae]